MMQVSVDGVEWAPVSEPTKPHEFVVYYVTKDSALEGDVFMVGPSGSSRKLKSPGNTINGLVKGQYKVTYRYASTREVMCAEAIKLSFIRRMRRYGKYTDIAKSFGRPLHG